MTEEFSREEIDEIFEECWNELIKEYPDARAVSTFCSESDVETHLAHSS